MTDPLITVEQLEARLDDEFTGSRLVQVEGLIADASALVRQVARTDFTSVPGVVVSVVVQMIKRELTNPDGLTAENAGAYGWQARSQTSSGMYVTRAERKIIREAAGRPAVIGMTMTSGLDDPWSGEIE